jgi:hypothetical protein
LQFKKIIFLRHNLDWSDIPAAVAVVVVVVVANVVVVVVVAHAMTPRQL